MKSKPFIINIQNISENDFETTLLDLQNINFFKTEKLKFNCGNNGISLENFLQFISNEKGINISEIKIFSSNINQQNQEYCIVRTRQKNVSTMIITEETKDVILNNEVCIKVGCFFKDAIITIFFYPK